MRSSLEDAGGATGPPPAAKSAVKALQKERLSPERLQELGGAEVECSVCRWAFVACPQKNRQRIHHLRILQWPACAAVIF